MSQHARGIDNPGDNGNYKGEGDMAIEEDLSRDSDDRKIVFPFLATPSGNLKVIPNQVVFESKKLSVLVANPKRTKVNVTAELGTDLGILDPRRFPVKEQEESEDALLHNEFECILNEPDENQEVSEADAELDLQSLGFSSKPIDWSKVPLLNKSDFTTLITYRITNNVSPDFTVRIGQEIFNCHLLVLQCYSQYFDSLKEAKRVELTESNVTPIAFNAIYNWMIYTGVESYQLLTRENILEVFTAAQFLGIKELEEHCWAFFDCDDLFSEDTAFQLYLRAKKMGNKAIIELMIPRITKFFLSLVSSKNFLELPIEDLCVILCSSYISVHGEIEVFMSAVRWLMHDWMRRKEHVSSVMNCIRFGLIAPWQLVDIRRNPENPEFTEITSMSEVTRLVEDGLAYAIIKHWYGDETPEYYHWINLLGLEEPTPRNWIGDEKTIITFKEFLEDLETYRQPQALANIPVRSKQVCEPAGSKNTAPDLKSLDTPPPFTLADLMGPDCKEKYNPKKLIKHDSILKGTRERRNSTINPKLMVGNKTKNSVVTLYEADSKNPKRMSIGSRSLQDNVAPSNFEYESSIKTQNPKAPNTLYEDSETVDSESIQDSTDEQKSPSVNYEAYQEKVSPTILKENEIFPREESIVSSMKNFNIPNQVHSSRSIMTTCRDTFTLTAAPVMTKERTPFQHTRQMSVSVLGPASKNYLAEGSLFFPDREAVLVFGGVDPHSQYGISRNSGKDIYRYQPDTNVWEFVGELPEPRHHHSVAFLKGRVFLVGGADPRDDDVRGKSVVVSTVWSYEPVTRSWFSESGMLTPRKNFGLVVSNGKLFAIGGQDRLGRVLSSVERFDPITGIWEEMAPLGVGRMGVAATKFRDLIWVAGGMTGCKKNPLSQIVECYDTRRNIWFPFSSLRFPCCFGRLYTMSDSLYLIGGAGRMTERDRTTSSIGVIDVWDNRAKEWRLQAEMAIPRHGHSVAYLGTQLLIIGGVTTVYMRALSNVECFCCERATWIRGVSNLPTTLSGHGSITLPPASLM